VVLTHKLISPVIHFFKVLEYLVGAATVCSGWSAYFRSFLKDLGVHLPVEWTKAPVGWDIKTETFTVTGSYVDLPAMAICLLITGLLCFGIRESARFNNVIVCIKVAVILIFIVVMAPKVNTDLWDPFIPPNEDGKFGRYGISGVFQGATTVFFACKIWS